MPSPIQSLIASDARASPSSPSGDPFFANHVQGGPPLAKDHSLPRFSEGSSGPVSDPSRATFFSEEKSGFLGVEEKSSSPSSVLPAPGVYRASPFDFNRSARGLPFPLEVGAFSSAPHLKRLVFKLFSLPFPDHAGVLQTGSCSERSGSSFFYPHLLFLPHCPGRLPFRTRSRFFQRVEAEFTAAAFLFGNGFFSPFLLSCQDHRRRQDCLLNFVRAHDSLHTVPGIFISCAGNLCRRKVLPRRR